MPIKYLQIKHENQEAYPSKCRKTMTVSQLIDCLQQVLRYDGDIPVFIEDDEYHYCPFTPIEYGESINVIEDYEDEYAGEQWCEDYGVEIEEEEDYEEDEK